MTTPEPELRGGESPRRPSDSRAWAAGSKLAIVALVFLALGFVLGALAGQRPAASSDVSSPSSTTAAPKPTNCAPTAYDAFLTKVGPNKIPVIKVVRELTGLGLKEAKDLVDAAPKAVKEDIARDEAEKVKAALEEQGAKVEIACAGELPAASALPTASAGPSAVSPETVTSPPTRGPQTFEVTLVDAGPNKIPVIKVVRELTGLGLKEAKDLVDAVPVRVKEGISLDEAEKIKAALEEVGATVKLRELQ